MSDEAVNEQVINEEVSVDDSQAANADALSFDDLDELTDNRSDSDVLKEALDANKEKNEGEEEQPQASEKSEAKEDSEESKEDQEDAEIQEEIKKYMGKYGEDENEIAAETMFKHKVDGEEVDVSLQELLNNYSGKIPFDKRYNELNQEKIQYTKNKEAHDKDVAQVNQYIDTFRSKLQNGDALGALSYFAEFSGMKPYEFRDSLLQQLAPEIDRIRELTSEEYRQEKLKQENEYLSSQKETEAKSREQEQAQWELKKEVANIQQTLNVSEAEFEQAYYALKESDYKGEISPSVVGEYIQYNKSYSRAEEILNQVDPSLLKQSDLVESLQEEIFKYPDWTDQDLREVVQNALGLEQKKASQSVSNKVNSAPKKQVKQQEREKEQYLSFEDL